MDILVINTDLMDRTVIQQVLQHSNHQVTFVENAGEAWKLIADGRFRFIIADASDQEGQSVHQLIQHVRSKPELVGQIYFLLILRKGQNGNLVTSLGAGTDDYLNKPIIPQELKARVSVGERILKMTATLSEAREQADFQPMYDELTGLLNQPAFYRVAQGELERARRTSGEICVIALDIDKFKAINEQHGKNIGDEVLQIVARIIREKSRPYDCIGRWDGDQYTLAFPGIVSTDAENITKRILSGVQASNISLPDGTAIEVRLSAGIAAAQTINAYAEIDNFIQSAVQALNNSKKNQEDEISVVYM
jgi:two-component system chemotaxis response regulator CheY